MAELTDVFNSGDLDAETLAALQREKITTSAVRDFTQKTKAIVDNNLFIGYLGRKRQGYITRKQRGL